MSTNNPSSIEIKNTDLGMALGLVLGGLFGLLVGNMILFAGGGLVIGMAAGAALDNRKKVH